MFTFSHTIKSAACAAALVAGIATGVSAQTADKRTIFTFSAPVALPGVTLPAGKYLFRLADPTTSGKVMQVLSEDGRMPYGLFFTIAAERPQPASTPEVRFIETAAGMPAAIKTWWYPGERRGFELVYPKEQARRLAQGASQPVLTTQAATTTTDQTNTPHLSRLSSGGMETSVDSAAAPGSVTPAGASREGELAAPSIAISTPTIPAAINAASVERTTTAAGSSDATARTALPQTATANPHLMLAALLAAGAGIGLWGYPGGRASA
jgi:hypothetical protein